MSDRHPSSRPEQPEHTCGAGSDGFVPLYDVEYGLAELAKSRRRRDHVTRATVSSADDLAHNLSGHFSAEELESIGRALVITSASLAGLIALPRGDEIQPAVLINLIAFAGQRLVVDARAMEAEPLS